MRNNMSGITNNFPKSEEQVLKEENAELRKRVAAWTAAALDVRRIGELHPILDDVLNGGASALHNFVADEATCDRERISKLEKALLSEADFLETKCASRSPEHEQDCPCHIAVRLRTALRFD